MPDTFDLKLLADELLERCFAQSFTTSEEIEKPTVIALARAANLSLTVFSDRFTAQTGERPSSYLKRRQIERAKQLLRETDLSIEDVAYRSCFANTVTFFRRFKQDWS